MNYTVNHYQSVLSVRETQDAIKLIRDKFQKELGLQLNLERISAPLFVEKSSGLNDDLSGVERPVSFDMKDFKDDPIEVVHSLAKWKRIKLAQMGVQPGRGIYTDMNALRPDEELDNAPIPYIIVNFDGLTNDVETKDDPFEGDTDNVQIGIEIAARTRLELGHLADGVRKAVHSYCMNANEGDEDFSELPKDYTFSANNVNYDPQKPCYWQILNYQCDCNNDVIADDDEQED